MAPRRAHSEGGDARLRGRLRGPGADRSALSARAAAALLVLAAAGAWSAADAQLDPRKRRLLQAGYSHQLTGGGQNGQYVFYYFNEPKAFKSDKTLRLAVAPVYLDSELGLPKALGENTDLGLGLAGGGFAFSHEEFRRGEYHGDESFHGNGLKLSGSLYHRFNPGAMIPLNGVLRAEMAAASYERRGGTAANFELPPEARAFHARAGLRFGGVEPVIMPKAAGELSLWYEGRVRQNPGTYGFAGDRAVQARSHAIWARALVAYTKESKESFKLGLALGDVHDGDRFSSFRIGGMLPLSSEFPLNLPGYAHQELTVRRFSLLDGHYSVPFGADDRWAATALAGMAYVDYLPGFEESGKRHAGFGADLRWRSPKSVWQLVAGAAYGATALRAYGRGTHSVFTAVQYDVTNLAGDLPFLRDSPFLRDLRERLGEILLPPGLR